MRQIIILLFLLPGFLFAEERIWIFFKDKGPSFYKNSTALARQQLTERAVERRYQRTDAPFFDYTDIPVYQEYINATCHRLSL